MHLKKRYWVGSIMKKRGKIILFFDIKKRNLPDVGDTIQLIRINEKWFNFSIQIKANHSTNWNRMK
jgi:hypothetical protein